MTGSFITIAISGRGSNALALVNASRLPGFPLGVGLIITNDDAGRENMFTLDPKPLFPVQVIPHYGANALTDWEARLLATVLSHKTKILCLAGFLKILSKQALLTLYAAGVVVLNIHPALLMDNPEAGGRGMHGLKVHRKVLEKAGYSAHPYSGCTVHFVTPCDKDEADTGPVVATGYVPVMNRDYDQILADRVLPVEHVTYPLAVSLVDSGIIKLSADHTRAVYSNGSAVGRRGIIVNPYNLALPPG